jgi:hypothetical protein
VKGTSRVKGVVVGRRELACDVLLVDAPRSPSYELPAQAGSTLVHEPRGYVVKETPPGVFVTGEAAGISFDARAIEAHARHVADRVDGR